VDKKVVIELVGLLGKKYTVKAILGFLGVPRSTYYRWLKGIREHKNEHEDLIIQICKDTKYRNGHHSDLQRHEIQKWTPQNKGHLKT
jgi:putative transposase